MRNLIRFLIQYHFTILFIVLEFIAVGLLLNYNSFHNAKIFKLRHTFVAGVSEKLTGFSNYLSLSEQNKTLVEENAHLFEQLDNFKYDVRSQASFDSIYEDFFKFIPAQVINISVNKQQNLITLNKGSLQGIEPEMGVICATGLVGIVKTVSRRFCTVIPIISSNSFNPSARIKSSGFYGAIEWPGLNYRQVILNDIPLHAQINIGDTIETSGISSTFPKGIMVGTIDEYEIKNGIKYEIKVELSTDYKKLVHVWVIKNMLQEEQKQLEGDSYND